MAGFAPLPRFAAWRHRDARQGFEVVFPRVTGDGYRFEGQTAAVEAGEGWSVGYRLGLLFPLPYLDRYLQSHRRLSEVFLT